jgi:hypothetical protein
MVHLGAQIVALGCFGVALLHLGREAKLDP